MLVEYFTHFEKEERMIGKSRAKRQKLGQFIVSDPEICHGKLTFVGTRIMVRTVLAYLASGKSVEWVVSEWPQLPREAVEEAMRLAVKTLIDRYEMKSAA